jgi:hypothetical protein
MKIPSFLLIVLLSSSALSCPMTPEEYELMKAKSELESTEKQMTMTDSGINLIEYLQVISKIRNHYTPLLKAVGKTLVIESQWFSPKINAFSTQSGSTYSVYFFGGLARNKFMTKDAYLLVGCHEMGHHLGGFPKYTNPGMDWASGEGQADYFAALKCFKNIVQDDYQNRFPPLTSVPANLKKECLREKGKSVEYNICLRGIQAGYELGQALFYVMKKTKPEPGLHFQDDLTVVSETNIGYSNTVCRSETFRHGFLCSASSKTAVGLKSETIGVCHGKNGHRVGERPSCWFTAKK